jgi:hypothetical protein
LILPYVDIPEVTWGFLMDEMKYLTELAVRDYYFSTQRTSTIALAAIFNVINDISTKERQELFGAFLRVIMDSFDFDDSEHIVAARARLSLLTKPETVLQEEDVDERSLDETSLDDSVKTFRVSNSSSKKMKTDVEGGHEHAVVTPNTSMRDVSCEEQDFQSNLSFC